MYYVVHPWINCLDKPVQGGGTYADWMKANIRKLKKQSVWSVSKDPKREGWDTDNGYQSEGGLTFDEATALVIAANKGLACEIGAVTPSPPNSPPGG